MLKALKKFFNRDATSWNHDYNELARLPFGAQIIDNGGVTAGWPAPRWTKQIDGRWRHNETTVDDSYFQMPFAFIGKTAPSQQFDSIES